MKINSKIKKPASISATISLAYMVCFTVVVAALCIFVLFITRRLVYSNIHKQADTYFEHLKTLEDIRLEKSKEYIIAEYDENFNLLYSSDEIDLPDFKKDTRYDFYYQQNHYVLLTYEYDGGYIQLARDMNNEDTVLSIISFVLILGCIASFIIVLLVGNSASRYLLKPILKMTETIRTISANNLKQRVDEKEAKSELKELAHTFNQMIDELERSYNAQQSFVSGASHELRTPLAIIAGYSDLLSRWGREDEKIMTEAIYAIKAQTARMQGLVERLLFLIRAEDESIGLVYEEFELKPFFDSIAKDIKVAHENINVNVNVEDNVFIRADKNLVEQLMLILLDNAVKYSGSDCSILIEGKAEDNFIVLSVADNGIGINEKDLNKVFDKFFRIDKSRNNEISGYGLGLSIARQIVLAHKGHINIYSLEQKGTKVTASFPIKLI